MAYIILYTFEIWCDVGEGGDGGGGGVLWHQCSIYRALNGSKYFMLCHTSLFIVFLCDSPMSLFISLLRHVTFYKYFIYRFILKLYFIRLPCQSSFSIKFQRQLYNFYKILTSYSTVFIMTSLASDSAIAVSHFVFYPRGALYTDII